jgi:hypothetical protein
MLQGQQLLAFLFLFLFELGGKFVQVGQQPLGERLVFEHREIVALHLEDLDGEIVFLFAVLGGAVGIGLDLGEGGHDGEMAVLEVHFL